MSAVTAFGWSQKGHDTVAYIAEKHLSEAAADSVTSLLDGKSPVYWANWLDNASHTPDYAYTKTWHYKNIDAGTPYDEAPTIKSGDVVSAAREQIAILADSVSTRSQKQLALKILIHLIGDMHQPMHMGHFTDRGGNNVKVRFFDRDSNLHSIWDGSIMNSGHAWSYTEWQQQLDRLSPEEERATAAGNIDDWGRETCEIASRVRLLPLRLASVLQPDCRMDARNRAAASARRPQARPGAKCHIRAGEGRFPGIILTPYEALFKCF